MEKKKTQIQAGNHGSERRNTAFLGMACSLLTVVAKYLEF